MFKDNIYKKALMLALPMMIQNGITNMVTLIDSVMVGSLGTEAMTAVSIAGQLIFVFNLAIFGCLSGPGIYAAQFYGQGNIEGFKNTFRLKILMVALCVVAGAAIFFFSGETLIGLYLKGDSSTVDAQLTMKYAKEYLNIMIIGLFPFVLTQVYATALRESGDSIKPMAGGIASVVIDIVFNYLLIYGNFGMPKLEVKGAAIATVMARFAEMLVVIIWAHIRARKHVFLKGIYKTLLVPRELSAKIIKKGMPIFLNEFLFAGALAKLTQCYSVRGLEIVAGLNISNTLCNLLNVVFVAMGSAVGIIIGQSLGASQYKKAEKDSFKLMWFTAAVTSILTLLLIAVSELFPEFYDTTAQVKNLGRLFIIITALFFPVQGFLNVLYFTLRSGGKTVITFLFDSVFSWAVAIPVAYVLSSFTGISIFVVYALVQAADIVKVLIGYILIKKKIWISNIVS